MAKKKKKKQTIYKIFSSLLLIFSFLFLGSVAYLNVLSMPLLLLVAGIIFLLDSGCLLLMWKTKKKTIGVMVTFLFVIILGIVSFLVNKTTGLLSNLNLDYKTYHYSVFVLETSDYQKLADLRNRTLGYYDDGSVEGTKALDKVGKKVELSSKDYNDNPALVKALVNKEIEAILIEETHLDILNESVTEGEKEYKDQFRKIYSFTVISKTSDISKDLNVTKEPFNIYISGIDTYGEISSVSRSDVNMIATIHPTTRQILFTSIPRDYYVQLHGKSGYKDKLTHAGLYGTDMSIQTIEDLLDIEINYYIKVNFSSVIDIIEAIGGVTVYSDYTFTSIDNFSYKKGYNEVNGEQALSFARERKAFAMGDRQRVKNQQALLKAIFEKCTSKAIITRYSKLLDSLAGSFVTNMKMSRLTSLVRMQLAKNYSWNLVTNSLNGKDASNYTYSAPSTKAYVMEPTKESVAYAMELINQVLKGETLDKEEVDADASRANKVTQSGTTSDYSTSSNSSKQENSVPTVQDGLEAKLGRSVVVFDKGLKEEYIYYPYTATYNGKDITKSSNITATFRVNGVTTEDYQELVLYVSHLDAGDYTIFYEIRYQGESVTLKQSVTVKETKVDDNPLDDEDEDDSLNKNEIDIDIPEESYGGEG